MKLTHVVEKKRERYNEAMRKRNNVNHSSDKEPRSYKTPQKRFAKVRLKESVQVILKPWNKWTNKIPEQLTRSVPEGYVITKQGIVSIRPKVHMTKKARRKARANNN